MITLIDILFLIIAVICFSLLVIFPKIGVWGLFFTSFFQAEYFLRLEGLNVTRLWAWFPFLITGALLLPLIMRVSVQEHNLFYSNSPIQKLLLLCMVMTIAGLFSCVLNKVPIITGLFGLRYLFLLVFMTSIFFIFSKNILSIETFAKLIVWVGLAQVPFCLLQRSLFFFFGIVANVDSSDLVSGTFTTYVTLVFMQMLSLGVVFCYWLRTGRPIVGKSAVSTIILLFFPLLISNSRASFGFLAVFLLLLAFWYRKHFIKRISRFAIPFTFLIAVMVVGVIFGFGYLQKQDYNRNLSDEYSFEHVMDYIMRKPLEGEQYHLRFKDPRMGRLAAIVTAYDLIRKDIMTFFFGLAPGNTQLAQAIKSIGQYYQRYGELSGLNRTELSKFLAEHGFIGLFLYGLFFWGIIKCIDKIKKINTFKYYIILDIFCFLIFLIILFSTYGDTITEYAVILCLAYFIATLQQEYILTTRSANE